MFALFYSLYLAMFRGTWTSYNIDSIFGANGTQKNILVAFLNSLGKLVTSVFGDNQYTNFGEEILINQSSWFSAIAFVLATITSIGIVFAAGKVLKRIFGVFFTLGR